MKCRYCNTELKKGAKFCPNCGEKVIEVNICIKCGEKIKPSARFCPFCGANQHELHAKQETTSEVEMIVEQSKEEPIEIEGVQADEHESIESPQPEQLQEQLVYYEEDESSIPWRTILVAVLIAAGAGWYFFIRDTGDSTPKGKDTKSSIEMKDNTPVDDEAAISKRLTEIYNDVCNPPCSDCDSKYCSKSFLALVKEFHEAYEKANTDELIGPDRGHWTMEQDARVSSMKVISISKLSDREAMAKIHIDIDFGDNSGNYNGHDVGLKLIYENGNWFIDDFICGDYSERDVYQGGIEILKDLANANKRISEAYIQKLKEHAKGEYMRCEYFLFDITKDGIPELWIVSGTCEADCELTTYTHDLKKIYQTSAMHSGFYKGNDYILKVGGHMGYSTWIKLYYDGNNIQEKKVFEEEGVEDYTKPKEKEITITDCNDITPIRNAFK